MVRRLVDIIVSLLMLMLLSPVFIVVYVMVALESSGPVIFRQARVGRNFKLFRIFKFRTMKINHQGDWITVGKDARLTRLGKKLRKLHIDELPQFLNVLLGDMSLIGPRPLTPDTIIYHRHMWEKVLVIKPGITGLAPSIYAIKEYKQLANSKDPKKTYIEHILKDKLKLEIFYIKHRGLLLDLKIIYWTILKLIGTKRLVGIKR